MLCLQRRGAAPPQRRDPALHGGAASRSLDSASQSSDLDEDRCQRHFCKRRSWDLCSIRLLFFRLDPEIVQSWRPHLRAYLPDPHRRCQSLPPAHAQGATNFLLNLDKVEGAKIFRNRMKAPTGRLDRAAKCPPPALPRPTGFL